MRRDRHHVLTVRVCTIALVSRELDVMIPTNPTEAVAAFGDGAGVTVIAGGTIVMPELTYGRLEARQCSCSAAAA